MSSVEKGDFKRKKLPDAFVSALEIQRTTAYYRHRRRSLEDLFNEDGMQYLSGFKAEIDKLAKDKPVRVLDLGCGEGVAVRDLQKKYPNWETHGIDLLPTKKEKRKEGKGEIIQGEASHLPYKSNQFDLVYSKFAYPYFPDKIKAVVEALRVTKPGGVVLISAEEGDVYELVEDTVVIKELEAKGIFFYSNMPGSKPGEVFKEINILKELHAKGIKGISEKDIISDKYVTMIKFSKSKGDDERAKLPFEFLRAVDRTFEDDSISHTDSFYKREPLKK